VVDAGNNVDETRTCIVDGILKQKYRYIFKLYHRKEMSSEIMHIYSINMRNAETWNECS
jgi:hypothetical protein